MSLSTDCRIAALVAFAQARAMGTGTNAGGGAITGAADCGRDPDGKFGGGNKCRWSGSTPDGTWEIEDNTAGTTVRIDADPAPHVLRLKGSDGNVKAFMHATVIQDQESIYVDYSHVADKERGRGVYTGLLKSLSEQFNVVSDSPPNLALPAAKAYKKLGAKEQLDGSYILPKKSGRSTRAFCPTGAGVVNDPTQTKTAWDGLSSKQRFKVKIDARYASLLAFAESRDCGRDESGKFSSGNTCASGVAAAAASGAVKGGIKGAITGLLTGGPAVVKPAAAIGAATGAVKGIYDNQMRPTRVKKTIERLGMDVKQVGNLVEKLGGTPESSADTKGGSLRLTIKDKEGKKTFSVEIDKKTITVYPRRATGELTTKEISRVKEIADKFTPKSISVVVKKSSSAYVSKLVRNGFTIAASQAGDILVATYLAAPVHSFANDAVQSVKKAFSRR